MTPIFKDPDAVLTYSIAWPPGTIGGAAISAASWSVEPDEPGGLAMSGEFVDGSETGARISGGLPGHVYRASCHIDLGDGRSADRSLLIRVDQR
ncbi:hypothetical protein [uncultured Parasphingopyxis sp.]|uniref:phage fiber-tail adaptor protein n=1 Tax=uncultured Parasphingopyxis sp. TaxID=1547918 RepID=UPI0026250E2F|nr:hypothetical protein [uncultured Parasphingopyxis sp.]